MKKLMVALAAVALAAVANASIVSWGLGSGNFDTTMFKNATAYLFYGAGSTLTLPSTTGWDNRTTAWTIDDLTSDDATQLYSADISNGKFNGTASNVSEGQVDDISGKTGVIKFYMAVISDDGMNVALVSGTKTGRIVAGTTAAGLKWTTTQVKNYTATPEPTSAMLLLLGMAGLALKRRRA